MIRSIKYIGYFLEVLIAISIFNYFIGLGIGEYWYERLLVLIVFFILFGFIGIKYGGSPISPIENTWESITIWVVGKDYKPYEQKVNITIKGYFGIALIFLYILTVSNILYLIYGVFFSTSLKVLIEYLEFSLFTIGLTYLHDYAYELLLKKNGYRNLK